MNRDLLRSPSRFLTTRAKQFITSAQEKIAEDYATKDSSTILQEWLSSIKNFFLTMGKPTFKKRPVYDGSPPCSSDINDSFIELYNDLRLMDDEQKMLGDSFTQCFNWSTTERLRLRNRIKYIGEKVNDYVVTAKNTLARNYVIQDSFVDASKADMSAIGNPANLDTRSGVVTLKINGQINRSKSAKVISVNAVPEAAMPGNFLCLEKKIAQQDIKINELMTGYSEPKEEWELLYSKDPHNDPAAMLDGEATTWYEHQLVNVNEELKKPGANPDTRGYGWTWQDGSPMYQGDKSKDSLDIDIIIELEEQCKINWIDFFPYLPDPRCYIRVNDIKTSLNNAGDYVTVLDPGDRGMKIGAETMPGLDFKDREKFKGHGTWTFPDREAKYVRFEFTVEKPYFPPIGHIYFEIEYDIKTTKRKLWKKSSSTEHVVERVEGRVDKQGLISYKDASLLGTILGAAGGILGAILGGALGKLWSTKREILNQQSRTGIDAYEGEDKAWRWLFGCRGIDINTNLYEENNVFMSKNFQVNKGIKELSLSVSELIPDEFFANDLSKKNTFIRYYISVDNGSTWIAISPLERMPVYGETNFPPKVISFVLTDVEDKVANKTFVKVEQIPTTVKLMAELSRPKTLDTMTPVIYDYQIRIVTKEDDATE